MTPGERGDYVGRNAYNMMLGDCLWHIYALIGKLTRRIYLLPAPDTGPLATAAGLLAKGPG